jgi:hypothetical protein
MTRRMIDPIPVSHAVAMRTRLHRAALVVACALLAGSALIAQPRADIRLVRPTPASGVYHVHVQVRCDGAPMYGLAASDFRITVNTTPVNPATIRIERAASATRNDCLELVMIVDNSSVLPGAALPVLPVAGTRLVDSLPLPCQRVGVITYSSSPRLREFVTSDRARIRTALADVSASGGSAMYDAVRAAMTELRLNTAGNAQYMLLAGTGRDNASMATRQQLVNELTPNTYDAVSMQLLTVPIGPDADTTTLRQLAVAGGGVALGARALDALPDLYDSLALQLRRGLDEYVLSYVTPVSPQLRHDVTVRVVACGDTAVATRTLPPTGPMTGLDRAPAPSPVAIGDLHPQPAVGILSISLTLDAPAQVEVVLRDVLGRALRRVHAGGLDAGVTTLRADVAGLAAGLYAVEVHTARAVVRKPFVVAGGGG